MQFSPDLYHRALRFAAQAHGEQRLPGPPLPYVVHLTGVAMEVMAAALAPPAAETAGAPPFPLQLAALCALLHDTVEDTEVTSAAVEREFGPAVASIVSALSKDPRLPKAERMGDSLRRIAALPGELARAAAIVKLADRITNLQPPPAHWPGEKRAAYQAEARLILAELGPLCRWPQLAQRLDEKIQAYSEFLGTP